MVPIQCCRCQPIGPPCKELCTVLHLDCSGYRKMRFLTEVCITTEQWRWSSPCFLGTSQIMESLGGDTAWFDRFVAQHAAIVYFWLVIVMYALSPRHAYQFSELVEGHATDTYEGVSPLRRTCDVFWQRCVSCVHGNFAQSTLTLLCLVGLEISQRLQRHSCPMSRATLM